MDLEKTLSELGEKAPHLKTGLVSEAATKAALVLPFIRSLGYDDSNPFEVVPEYTADFGDQNNAKVDYAIMHDGEPALLFECKHITDNLESAPLSQLMRYFAATEARIGILTNGFVYKFFSDLDESNKMDKRPFLVVDLTNLGERSIEELSRFTKQRFNVEETLEAAAVLKYTRGMKHILGKQLNNPDDTFIKWLVKQVYNGVLNKKQMERFTPLVGRAFKEFINDRINQTLTKALDRDAEEKESIKDDSGDEKKLDEDDDGIVTTLHEIEGYTIVKAILRHMVDMSRVTMKDHKSFCNILFEGNAQKRICRLYFNNEKNLRLGVFNEEKKEAKHSIESPDGIYAYADEIAATTQHYVNEEPTP